ncbi:immunoglobulin superfamily member 5, partial [Austrofundulus limnaeus]|uniref:immunoglobulin superfamily member 5 n=1 Tax=Austrofundulus limnaeus TaxID=52670 RepID=UPI0006B36F04
MVASWTLWLSLYSTCSILCSATTQELQLEPMNSAVLLGSDARFIATIQGPWQVMSWMVGGSQVLTVIPNEIISPSDQFSASLCSNSCVEFIIHNVSHPQAGPVTCYVQAGFAPKTAQLSVQESGAVSIQGGNVTVKQDQQVEFQCVTTAWLPAPSVSWNQNGQAVNSS